MRGLELEPVSGRKFHKNRSLGLTSTGGHSILRRPLPTLPTKEACSAPGADRSCPGALQHPPQTEPSVGTACGNRCRCIPSLQGLGVLGSRSCMLTLCPLPLLSPAGRSPRCSCTDRSSCPSAGVCSGRACELKATDSSLLMDTWLSRLFQAHADIVQPHQMHISLAPATLNPLG